MGQVIAGDTIGLSVALSANAADIALSVLDPDGVALAGFPVTPPAVTTSGTGLYAYDWTVSSSATPGTYLAVWTGTPSGGDLTTRTEEVVVFGTSSTGAYASRADFLATFDTPPSAAKYARIDAILADAAAMIDGEVGWDFHSHGPEARIFDGPLLTRRRLCVHGGIASLTKVETRSSAGASWTELAADDWYLEPREPLETEPYTHLVLTGCGTVTYFPAGDAVIRLTGTFGCAAPPTRVVRANVALARQIYLGDSTISGGMVGPNDWQAGPYPESGRWPDSTWRAVRYYRNRDKCWV